MNILLFLIPGAITYMTIYRLGNKRNDSIFLEIMRYLVYTGLNAILFLLLFMRPFDQLTVSDLSSISHFLTFKVIDLLLMFACAFLLGIIIHLFGNNDNPVNILEAKTGLWTKLSQKQKKIVKAGTLIGAIAFLVIMNSFYMRIPQADIEVTENVEILNSPAAFKSNVKKMLDEITEDITSQIKKGVSPEDIGSLTYESLDVERVYEDNRWNSISEDYKPHAIYMLDGNGAVVYFSYKDSNNCITWSGHSDDQAFIQANGGWGNGDGYGWTGPATQ